MKANETKEEAIVRLKTQCNFTYQMFRDLGFTNDKVSEVLAYYKKFQQIMPPKEIGRSKKITNEMITLIESETLQNPKASIDDIRSSLRQNFQGISLSVGTVSKIRSELRFHYKPPKIRQELSPIQIKKRLRFAHTVLASGFDLSNIIFSDEARICNGPDNKLLWRR